MRISNPNRYHYQDLESILGSRLTLKPIHSSDFDEIISALYSPTTWMSAQRGVTTHDKLRTYLQSFVDRRKNQELVTLVARTKSEQEVTAISTFHSAPLGFTKVEIGYTWIADKWMRTFVNTEIKYLMLNYAFHTMKVKRVEFSVDPRNEKSNLAMKRIGAKFEGTLRKWRFLNETDPGDRNIYSIIDDEWPDTKSHFEKALLR